MAREKVVLDASVIAKWYLTEWHSDSTLSLRDTHVSGNMSIVAPTLLIYEALNVLKHCGIYSQEELVELALSLDKYGFE